MGMSKHVRLDILPYKNGIEEYRDWQEPNDCPYCNLPNSELWYDLVEEDDGSNHDTVDCPRYRARLFYED